MAPFPSVDDLSWSTATTTQTIPTDQPSATNTSGQEHIPMLTNRDSDIHGWDDLGGAIAGIVVGSLVGAALIGYLIYYLDKRRQAHKAKKHHETRVHRKSVESSDVEEPPMAVVNH